MWADLNNKLPFHDNSVDAFYSHHMIEHLPDIQFHLREVYRCLKPEGVYRVGGPNGDSAIINISAASYRVLNSSSCLAGSSLRSSSDN